MEQHGDPVKHPCSFCPLVTKRNADLNKHIQRIHGKSIKVISHIIDRIISGCVGECEEGEHESDEVLDREVCPEVNVAQSQNLAVIEEFVSSDFPEKSVSQEDTPQVYSEESAYTPRHTSLEGYPVSEYEMIRNRNIAERVALFKLLNPTFEDEIKSLKPVPKKRKVAPKGNTNLPLRQSSRILNKQARKEVITFEVGLKGDADVLQITTCESDLPCELTETSQSELMKDPVEVNEESQVSSGEDVIECEEESDVANLGRESVNAMEVDMEDIPTLSNSNTERDEVDQSTFSTDANNSESGSTVRKFACLPCDMEFG